MSESDNAVSYRPAEGVWRRPDRPGAVSVISYVLIGLGYVGFLLKGVFLVVSFLDVETLRGFNPDFNRPELTRAEFAISTLQYVAGMLVSLTALAGGIGLLKMRGWGRRLAIAYAVAALLMTVSNGVWKLATFDRQFELMVQSNTRMMADPSVSVADRKNKQFTVWLLAPIAQLMLPGAILGILTRRHIIEAFNEAQKKREERDARL